VSKVPCGRIQVRFSPPEQSQTGRSRVLRHLDGSGGDGAVLVPLTNSLYVRGQLLASEHVVVDVGTGYFIEKVRDCLTFRITQPLILRQDVPSAVQFYEEKVRELDGNMQDLDAIVQRKTSNVRALDEGEHFVHLSRHGTSVH
jgi:prefoldin subunit 5